MSPERQYISQEEETPWCFLGWTAWIESVKIPLKGERRGIKSLICASNLVAMKVNEK